MLYISAELYESHMLFVYHLDTHTCRYNLEEWELPRQATMRAIAQPPPALQSKAVYQANHIPRRQRSLYSRC